MTVDELREAVANVPGHYLVCLESWPVDGFVHDPAHCAIVEPVTIGGPGTSASVLALVVR